MIGSLRGSVVERRPLGDSAVELVVDVGGVGYRVAVSPRTAAGAGGSPRAPAGAGAGEVTLAVHTHVREGAITLYGFTDSEERRCFELLISAHGVGPALALAVLSVHRPAALSEIVVGNDVESLTLVPGVGRKTAERLLVDLRSRFEVLDGPIGATAGPAGAPSPSRGDVAEALSQLGYAQEEIRSVLRDTPEDVGAEEMLRQALHRLAPRR